MRIELAFLATLGMCAAAVACGAKVTVDVGSQGAGGVGGTTTTASGMPTGTTSSGISCTGVGCSGSSDGSCDCQGVCNAQKLEVQCVPAVGGNACTCIENGVKIAVCQQGGSATCSFTAECCASQFFGFGSSSGTN